MWCPALMSRCQPSARPVRSAPAGRSTLSNLSVTLVLAFAANTSFRGLPVLMSLLTKDNRLPHMFGLRAERPVFRYGVAALSILSALLLIVISADTNRLLPLFAIGVFIGFTISQTGLVRHSMDKVESRR